jgi:hypothetical protein
MAGEERIISLKEARVAQRRKQRGNGHGNGATPISGDYSVDGLNREYALLLHGGKASVMRLVDGPHGRPRLDFLTVQAFRQFFANHRVPVGEHTVSIADLWLKDERRRSYTDIVFAPGQDARPGVYNIWSGFAVEPRPGPVRRFLEHVLTVICNGNKQHARWVLGWFAHIFQRPTEKLGTSLALRGGQGTGKTILGQVVGSLLGPHYVLVADPRRVTGRFNAHVEGCLLLHADEAFWAGDKQALGTLKDLVTSPVMHIERKGKESIPVRNYLRLFVSSNESWVVPAGIDERRFTVLDVSSRHQNDSDYFKRLMDELDNGGREGLLHFFLNFDLDSVDLHRVLQTPALAEQKLEGLETEERWWFECLNAGAVLRNSPWPSVIAREEFIDAYIGWAERHNVKRRAVATQLGKMLRRFVPGVKSTRSHYGPRGYRLPSLEVCRDAFCTALGIAVPWEPEGEEIL